MIRVNKLFNLCRVSWAVGISTSSVSFSLLDRLWLSFTSQNRILFWWIEIFSFTFCRKLSRATCSCISNRSINTFSVPCMLRWGGKRLTFGSIYMYFITLSVVKRILKRSTSSLLVKLIFVKIKKYLWAFKFVFFPWQLNNNSQDYFIISSFIFICLWHL